MGWRARSGLGCLALLGVALLARSAVAQALLTFEAPHVARPPAATLDAAFGRRIDGEAAAARITGPDDLVGFALRVTARTLHFGLAHPTRLSFDGVEREANCVEYAALCGAVVDRERGSLDVRAWVVRSDARVLGTAIPDPAWKDHDWVLVERHTPEGPRRLYVDPTLYDAGLGWDISRAVRGEVRLPGERR